jgi:hypothetical protein
MVLRLVLVQERRLPVKPAADNVVHGQQASLPARQDALSGVLSGFDAGDLGVQMTWISPVFPGQDHNSDVT